MVGDGVNDAPALAVATVGVALGARGASASSEAADVVVTVDRVDRVGEALVIAKRSRAIAVQSVQIGMGLSVVAMAAAALGLLPPTAGALLQEVIDVTAILNALRALRGGRAPRPLTPAARELGRRFADEHELLRPLLERLRPGPPDLAAVTELVKTAYGLLAVLRLHFAQEEEAWFSQLDAPAGAAGAAAADAGPTAG